MASSLTHKEFLLPVEDCVLDEALRGVDDSQALEHLLKPLQCINTVIEKKDA